MKVVAGGLVVASRPQGCRWKVSWQQKQTGTKNWKGEM